MHDSRLGRFFAVDPLAAKYPWNSTYAFSENRVVDGVELEGLEYLRFNVFLDKKGSFIRKNLARDYTKMSDDEIEKVHGISASQFYKKNSKAFGSEGRNVIFDYYQQDESGHYSLVDSKKEQKSNRERLLGTRYGLYAGRGSVTKKGPKFPEERRPGGYDFSLQPIDLVDQIAKMHDFEEDMPDFVSWTELRFIGADIRFVTRLTDYLERVKDKNFIDPYTGKRPSTRAIYFAVKARDFFLGVIKDKKYLINEGKDIDQKTKLSEKDKKWYLKIIEDAEKD